MDYLLAQKLNDSIVRDPLADFKDKAVTELDSPKQQAVYAFLDSFGEDDDFSLDNICTQPIAEMNQDNWDSSEMVRLEHDSFSTS